MERHVDELFLVVATNPGAVAELNGTPLEPRAGQDDLPVRFAVAILPEEGGSWLQDGAGGSGSSIGVDDAPGMAARGARSPGSAPAIPACSWSASPAMIPSAMAGSASSTGKGAFSATSTPQTSTNRLLSRTERRDFTMTRTRPCLRRQRPAHRLVSRGLHLHRRA